jgi:hypothetical protein
VLLLFPFIAMCELGSIQSDCPRRSAERVQLMTTFLQFSSVSVYTPVSDNGPREAVEQV